MFNGFKSLTWFTVRELVGLPELLVVARHFLVALQDITAVTLVPDGVAHGIFRDCILHVAMLNGRWVLTRVA